MLLHAAGGEAECSHPCSAWDPVPGGGWYVVVAGDDSLRGEKENRVQETEGARQGEYINPLAEKQCS